MLIPVILSGGAGTRLWPVSREGHPKPFMKMKDGQSLLQKTLSRAVSVASQGGVLLVTNRDYYLHSKDEVQSLFSGHLPQIGYLLEPCGRNTMPAIGMAAHLVSDRYGADAVMLVLPADHLITGIEAFVNDMHDAAELARAGYLVTFGVPPTAPETGFGYIERGDPLAGAAGSLVKRFVEKPDQERARQYMQNPDFLWNSGVFCAAAGQVLAELQRHQPEMAKSVSECWQYMQANADSERLHEIPEACFQALPDISIDYALLEKSDRVAVVTAHFDWSDIGSWRAVSAQIFPDDSGNRCEGEVVLVDAHDNYIRSEERLTAAVGVDNLIIVDTADALLVARADKSQEVREVVSRLKSMEHDSYRLHRTVCRPWGTYTVLEAAEHYKIKRIDVKPGGCLSLQMHHHRSEHWIVVSGMARVTKGEEVFLVHTNQSTYIPPGHVHRLENPGVVDLVMIEVQSGDYLGEDDIVRYEDQYGRI